MEPQILNGYMEFKIFFNLYYTSASIQNVYIVHFFN